jgi:hypothetical protein
MELGRAHILSFSEKPVQEEQNLKTKKIPECSGNLAFFPVAS